MPEDFSPSTESYSEGPVTKEYPEAWFVAVKAANEKLPFSNAGVATYLLNAMHESKLTPEEIATADETDWQFSSSQRQRFVGSMHAHHVRYGTPVADMGMGAKIDAGIKKKHGVQDHGEVREIDPMRWTMFPGAVVETARRLLGRLVVNLALVLPNPEEERRIIPAYVRRAVEVMEQTPEVQEALVAYLEAHKVYSLSGAPANLREKDAMILETRARVADAVLDNLRLAMASDPVLENYAPEKRLEILDALEQGYRESAFAPLGTEDLVPFTDEED